MFAFRNLVLWLVIIVVSVTFYSFIQGNFTGDTRQQVGFSQFWNDASEGRVESAVFENNHITGRYADGHKFESYVPFDVSLPQKLTEMGVEVRIIASEDNSLLTMLLSWLPMFIILGVWIFFMRQMQGGGGRGGGAFGFGRSRAKMLNEVQGRVTFSDVAGIEEAKEELNEIVDFLKNPEKFQKLGGRIPKGALLIGPPGTGKTLLARAIAGEANVPFFSISGSDFVEMFVGVGASRVRNMFEQAKKNAPCIVFIDEIDAVGRHRGAGYGGGNDEREQTLNQLLVEMDGFEANENIILLAATNRPDVLDPALLRPGRFDRQVVVPNPDIVGREAILKVHAKKIAISPDVDIMTVARGTPGFSGADLANLVNEAALMAARSNKMLVTMEDFESAKDKVMMGAERRSMVMTDDEKKLTAYHEAGHALVGWFVPGNDPLHKVTIIPRGRALGVTVNLPERDRFSMRKSEIEARLAMMYGGRVAEQLIFGEENVTTGASNDIMKATDLAQSMVTVYGMSKALGPLRYTSSSEEEGYPGQTSKLSPETQKLIDSEVRRIIEIAEQKAIDILKEHMDELHLLAKGLLEYETLDGEEVKALLAGNNVDALPTKRDDTSQDDTTSSSLPSVTRDEATDPDAE